MDERTDLLSTNGSSEPGEKDGAGRLERRADELRDSLREVVGELEERRHAVGRKFGQVALAGAAVAATSLVGAAIWAAVRRRPRGVERLAARWVARREPAAATGPSVVRRLLGVAVEAAVAVASRELASRALARQAAWFESDEGPLRGGES